MAVPCRPVVSGPSLPAEPKRAGPATEIGGKKDGEKRAIEYHPMLDSS
jgi:hypothetical protein